MLLAAACGKEEPFHGKETVEEGKILKSAISVDLKTDETVRKNVRTRADVNPDDFTIIFTKVGKTSPEKTYKYGEMPDPITLPAGEYTCTATLGENRQADWENPYFLGVSETFEVKANEITSYISPIECKLENIKVTIEFDAALKSQMSEDSYVEVKVGANSSLKYTLAETEGGKAGYFMHTAETTLVATFNGKIDGVSAVETKSLNNVSKGNHYKITFKLHNYSGDPTGAIESNVQVDASVVITDVTRNIELPDEPLLDDTERPSETPETPVPDDPVTNKVPEIVGVGPVNIDAVNDGHALSECVVNITSYAEGGITDLVCDIDSPTLTPEELDGVGLRSHLDLGHTPEDLQGTLTGLGFPTNVAGDKKVVFNITNQFMGLLGALGAGEHHFVISVTDANGTTVKTLKIKF